MGKGDRLIFQHAAPTRSGTSTRKSSLSPFFATLSHSHHEVRLRQRGADVYVESMTSWTEDDLVPRLEVEPAGKHDFESRLEGFDGRTFGGEVLAKAATAALRTANERSLHSLHAYFLRPVPPDELVRFTVHALSNGRRLASRRVAVHCAGRLAAEILVSLAADFEGSGFEDRPHPLDLPPPSDLPSLAELAQAEGLPIMGTELLEWRHVEIPWRAAASGEPATARSWVRLRRPLPDEHRLHAAALTYLSDFGLLGIIRRRLGEAFEWNASASLDHALWLHRPFCWNDWILIDSHTEIAYRGRVLVERRFYASDGRRIATIAQEGLFGTK